MVVKGVYRSLTIKISLMKTLTGFFVRTKILKKRKQRRRKRMAKNITEIRKEGWNPMESEQGFAWFGGKSHQQLAEWLPEKALEDENFEDIDFLVVGWRKV
tara:strand:+ start:918 stop:1220 length:303 start_codon:yes stop_codon:yes gene_type:complete